VSDFSLSLCLRFTSHAGSRQWLIGGIYREIEEHFGPTTDFWFAQEYPRIPWSGG
jgi:hypothetical protein